MNNYKEYLKSEHWLNVKANIYSKVKSCQLCHSRYSLNIHHLTYENIGNERSGDLIVLCGVCHKKHHRGLIKNEDIKWLKSYKPKGGLTNIDKFNKLIRLYNRALRTRDFNICYEFLKEVDGNDLRGGHNRQFLIIKAKIEKIRRTRSKEPQAPSKATVKPLRPSWG